MDTNKNISSFFNTSPAIKNKLKDVSSRTNSNGDLTEIYDANAIINSINVLLTTIKGSYLFDPNLGVGLHKYIFEPADIVTKNAIVNEVKTAISKYERRAKITFDVSFFSNKKGFNIDIYVEVNNNSKAQSTITIDNSILREI